MICYGPCEPCSELHVDLTPEGNTEGKLVNADDARCIELLNLVFIQYNAESDGSFRPLPECQLILEWVFRACSMIQELQVLQISQNLFLIMRQMFSDRYSMS